MPRVSHSADAASRAGYAHELRPSCGANRGYLEAAGGVQAETCLAHEAGMAGKARITPSWLCSSISWMAAITLQFASGAAQSKRRASTWAFVEVR